MARCMKFAVETRLAPPTEYANEPYVIAQFVMRRDADRFVRASNQEFHQYRIVPLTGWGKASDWIGG